MTEQVADGGTRTITRHLQAWSDGDPEAREQLFELVYAQLSQMAANRLRNEREGFTLETRELVHEAFLRLVDQRKVRWQDRSHFFSLAARIMRRILVDYARRGRSLKRGGDQVRVSPEDSERLPVAAPPDLLELHEALGDLERQDSKLAQVVLLRTFGRAYPGGNGRRPGRVAAYWSTDLAACQSLALLLHGGGRRR